MEIDWIPVTELRKSNKHLIHKARIDSVIQIKETMGDIDLVTQINTIDDDHIQVQESIDDMFAMLNGLADFTQETDDKEGK